MFDFNAESDARSLVEDMLKADGSAEMQVAMRALGRAYAAGASKALELAVELVRFRYGQQEAEKFVAVLKDLSKRAAAVESEP